MFLIQLQLQNYIPIGKSKKPLPFFIFQRRCEQMDHCPLNTKFLKKLFFNTKTLINYKFQKFSQNFTSSRSLMLPQETKESAAGTLRKQKSDELFFNELTGISLHKELSIILQVIVERVFSLNKNLMAKNMEELTIQSCHLINDHVLSGKLLPRSLDISNKLLTHVNNDRQRYQSYLQENRGKKQQHANDQQKRVIESG